MIVRMPAKENDDFDGENDGNYDEDNDDDDEEDDDDGGGDSGSGGGDDDIEDR